MFEQSLISIFEQIYLQIGYTGIVIGMAIESAGFPLPSEVILPMAGWMVSRHAFTFWGATLAGTAGSVVGSAIAYVVGAQGGRPLLDRYGRYLLISQHHLDAADRWFARYGHGAVFVARLVPLVRTFISFPAGIARMPFRRFVIYTAAGSFLWSLALVYTGRLLGDNWEALRSLFQSLDVTVVVLAVVAVGWYVTRLRSHPVTTPKDPPSRR